MRFEPNVFPDRVDRRLYQAKSVGRDRICDV
jgi:PleD family two-component response regulator